MPAQLPLAQWGSCSCPHPVQPAWGSELYGQGYMQYQMRGCSQALSTYIPHFAGWHHKEPQLWACFIHQHGHSCQLISKVVACLSKLLLVLQRHRVAVNVALKMEKVSTSGSMDLYTIGRVGQHWRPPSWPLLPWWGLPWTREALQTCKP